MKLTTATFCDLACLLLFLLVVARYAMRGFLADLAALCGNLLSLGGSVWLSKKYAPVIFEQLLRPTFISRISDTISAEGLDLSGLVEQYAGFLPDSVKTALVQSAGNLLDPVAPNLAQNVVDNVIEPLFTPLIAIVLFFVVYALLRMLVSLLVSLFTGLNKIPVAGSVNRILGLVLGVLAGVLDLYFVMCIVWSLLVLTGDSLPFLNEQELSSGIVYGVFCRFNPFL